ncbi:MAG: hypothetical protein OEY36_10060 [Gammaproteobacteria bacterium]|nr:hypothetical protein [Gammaproteobacteria bacterium]
MKTLLHEDLRLIGLQLDKNIFPRVLNGGVVMPSKTAIPSIIMGEVSNDERRKRQKRPETRQGQRPPRWQGETRGRRKTSGATQVISSSIHEKYMDELVSLKEAYPGMKIWEQKDGMWLLCQSALIPNALHRAIFLCGIPFDPRKRVRSWGFWNEGVWIGPRHTNMPDGSICAFEPSDGTWLPGDSIIKLLDIYTLWAVRHLHLQVLNRWPGAQVAHHAYERLSELKEDELCGCGSFTKKYGECCRPNDLRRDRVADATKFIFDGGADRKPPEDVMRFIDEKDTPPLL